MGGEEVNTNYLDSLVLAAKRVDLLPKTSVKQGGRKLYTVEAPPDVVALCEWPQEYKNMLITPVAGLSVIRIVGDWQYIEIGALPWATPFWEHLKIWPGGNNGESL